MKHEITIRKSNLSDEGDIVALWHMCALVASYNDPSEDFRRAVDKESSDVLVGIDQHNNLISSIMVGHEGHRGWVYYLAVSPSCRNRGIGRLMMQQAERWLAERNIPKLQLLIRETNLKVTEFYNRLGYAKAPVIVMSKWVDGKQH